MEKSLYWIFLMILWEVYYMPLGFIRLQKRQILHRADYPVWR